MRRLRPSHPLPYVRDDRETPLCVGRDGERYVGDLGQKGTEEFLQRGLDTPPIGEPSDLPDEIGQVVLVMRQGWVRSV